MSQSQCRLCSSHELRLHFEVRGSILDRCRSCGFVQVRERPTEVELRTLYAEGYFKKGKYGREYAQRKENERRLRLLERADIAPGGRVLDAGCATGDFLEVGRDRYEMWGLDVSAYATDVARTKNPTCAARIRTGFVEEQAFEPDFFDAIVLWDVVEHIWDPRSVLERLVSHLRPGGSLLFSTPDIGALTARLMRRHWAFMTPPEHLGFFSPKSIGHLLSALRLEAIFSTAKGKWANLGFLFYKLDRVFPRVFPAALLRQLQQGVVADAAVYVPTADIRYVLARKPEE